MLSSIDRSAIINVLEFANTVYKEHGITTSIALDKMDLSTPAFKEDLENVEYFLDNISEKNT